MSTTRARPRSAADRAGGSVALATFAEIDADQNERDYATLKAAADSGRIKIKTGL